MLQLKKPRMSQDVKTCAQGHTASQELCQEQKQDHQTLTLAQFHFISLHPEKTPAEGVQGAPQVQRK